MGRGVQLQPAPISSVARAECSAEKCADPPGLAVYGDLRLSHGGRHWRYLRRNTEVEARYRFNDIIQTLLSHAARVKNNRFSSTANSQRAKRSPGLSATTTRAGPPATGIA